MHLRIPYFLCWFIVLLCGSVAAADSIEVQWLGHATTRITSATGKVIVIDPFLTTNPKAALQYRDLKALGKVDLILVTHGHSDHTGDLLELQKLTNAKVVAQFELGRNLTTLGFLDENVVIAMNKGGSVEPLGRGIKIRWCLRTTALPLMLTLSDFDLRARRPLGIWEALEIQ